MGPESIPESNWIIVTPVYLSPARIVDDTGEAPLYLGKSEGWRLIQPCRKALSTSGGNKIPYAATTAISASVSYTHLTLPTLLLV